ncbi:MAG TPA: PLP-dependent aminotransferase family protein [Candidatus Sulfomarinibacteraceae bacterium]|nr:PLP-dependent aminotransferase family protein [Candidatus Sulfomarinibacteraceae bacterium]
MDLHLTLDEAESAPLYRQLYTQIRERILEGELAPGSKLPPTRTLARRLELARVTVIQAYDQLQAEGYVRSRRGAGTFVSDKLPLEALEHEDDAAGQGTALAGWGRRVLEIDGRRRQASEPGRFDIDFGFGRSFPHIFPYDVWRRLLARYLSTDDVMLSRYGSVSGFHPLREAIADYLARLRGVHCRPDEVVIVNGAQQALDILSRLLLETGDEVLVETPGYTDAFDIFRVYGTRLTALTVDEHGFPVEAIPRESQAKLAFVTPTNQFPRGGAMPARRRLALLQWAREQQATIIEDDYDGALRYEEQPLAALQGLDEDGRVVYLGTFSKVLFPALRLGYVVLPPALLHPFIRAKSIVDRGAPTLTQAAVADFIREGHFERHLRRLRKEYGRRRAVLVRSLHDHLGDSVSFAREPAGLHVMLYLDPAFDEGSVVQCAADQGVGVYRGAPYHLQQPAPPSILLGFSGLSVEEIEEGVRRLGRALNKCLPAAT